MCCKISLTDKLALDPSKFPNRDVVYFIVASSSGPTYARSHWSITLGPRHYDSVLIFGIGRRDNRIEGAAFFFLMDQ